MKRTVLLLLALAMLLTSLVAFSSCKKKGADGSETPETETEAAAKEACVELFETLLESSFSLDYRTQYTLFPEASLTVSLYESFHDLGFADVETALRAMEAAVADLRGFERVRVEYSVKKWSYLDAQRAKDFWDEVLSQQAVGKVLDRDKMEGYLSLDLTDVRVYFEELFVLEQSKIDLEFIRYDGKWYLNPVYIEEERCIELLESRKEDGSGFYQVKRAEGAVTAITDQYLVLSDEAYYWIGDRDLGSIAVGDVVALDYVSLDMEAPRIADGKNCYVRVLYSIHQGKE